MICFYACFFLSFLSSLFLCLFAYLNEVGTVLQEYENMFSLVLCLWDRQWHLYIGWCHARRQHISTLALSDSSKGSWRSSPCKRLPNLSSGLRQSAHALANTGYWHNGMHTFSLYTKQSKHVLCCISKQHLYIIWCSFLHVYTPLVAQTNHVWIFGMAFDGFQNGDGCQWSWQGWKDQNPAPPTKCPHHWSHMP